MTSALSLSVFSLPLQVLVLALLQHQALSQSCSSHVGTSCAQCTGAGCSWCPISGLCVPLSQTISHGCRFRMNSPSSCPSSYCKSRPSYGTCGMCTSDYFCYWCASTGSCGSWGQCSTTRVIGYPFDCWAAAPPPPADLPTMQPTPAPAPAPVPVPAPSPAPPADSQLPAYTPCVSGYAPDLCSREQLNLQATPGMCPNGPAYFAPFGVDSVSKCSIMPSRSVFAGDLSCSAVPVPSHCSAASKHWGGLGASTSSGMCSPSVPVWAPYGRDTSACPIVWCPQGCTFIWQVPSSPSPSPAPATPTPPSIAAPVPPSSCAGGTFATASSTGSSACSLCPPGAFCPPGSNAPTPCPAGTLSNFTGASSSTASSHSATPHHPNVCNPLQVCTPCPPASFCPAGSNAEYPCKAFHPASKTTPNPVPKPPTPTSLRIALRPALSRSHPARELLRTVFCALPATTVQL